MILMGISLSLVGIVLMLVCVFDPGWISSDVDLNVVDSGGKYVDYGWNGFDSCWNSVGSGMIVFDSGWISMIWIGIVLILAGILLILL